MRLGESLAQARKKAGLTQEAVAEKLGVSRQTISKWETDETLPDIRQSKKLADLYQVTLDELVAFDFEVQELTEMIDRVSDEVVEKVDWTAVWAQKYPILARYPQEMDTTLTPRRCVLCWRSCSESRGTARKIVFWSSKTFLAAFGAQIPCNRTQTGSFLPVFLVHNW